MKISDQLLQKLFNMHYFKKFSFTVALNFIPFFPSSVSKMVILFLLFLFLWLCVLVTQLCPTLWDPMDCSLPGSLSTEFPRQQSWSGLPLVRVNLREYIYIYLYINYLYINSLYQSSLPIRMKPYKFLG